MRHVLDLVQAGLEAMDLGFEVLDQEQVFLYCPNRFSCSMRVTSNAALTAVPPAW